MFKFYLAKYTLYLIIKLIIRAHYLYKHERVYIFYIKKSGVKIIKFFQY